MHILIISHYFPPLNEIASIRLFCFAKYWDQQGVRVSVLTTKKGSGADLSFKKELSPSITIHEIEYEKKFGFLSAGPNTANNTTQGQQKKNKSPLFTILKNIGRKVYYGTGLSQMEHYNWIKKAVVKGMQIANEEQITHIFSSLGPAPCHIIASRMVDKLGPEVCWVADYRDLWSQNHIYATKGLFNVLEKKYEKNLLAKARLITTVSDPLNKALSQLHSGKEVLTLYNGYDPDDFQTIIPATAHTPKQPRPVIISYLGRIYRGFRDPSPLFRAIKELEKEGKIKKGELIIRFYGQFMGNLQELIDENDAGGWVEIMGQINYKDSLRVQRESYWLLFLESSRKEAAGVLPGKLFEYIMSRTPILGVGVDELTAAGQLIIESNTGLALGNNVEAIKSAIINVILAQFSGSFQVNESFMRKYSRKEQAQEFLTYLKSIK